MSAYHIHICRYSQYFITYMYICHLSIRDYIGILIICIYSLSLYNSGNGSVYPATRFIQIRIVFSNTTNSFNLKFKSKTCWKRHQKQVHTQERKFKCRFCVKTFKTSSNLKVHENIHLGVFEARCEICNLNFVQGHNLQLHNRKHHS